MFAGYGIYYLFKKELLFKVLAVFGIILLTASGIIHMLVVKNDVYAKVPDSAKSNFGLWIKKNTSSRDIFLTNGEIYDPASLVGARIFLGRPHYIFLFGGDPSNRINEKKAILSGKNNIYIKRLLLENKLKYVIVYKEGVAPNLAPTDQIYFMQNYKKVYEDNLATIYKI